MSQIPIQIAATFRVFLDSEEMASMNRPSTSTTTAP